MVAFSSCEEELESSKQTKSMRVYLYIFYFRNICRYSLRIDSYTVFYEYA